MSDPQVKKKKNKKKKKAATETGQNTNPVAPPTQPNQNGCQKDKNTVNVCQKDKNPLNACQNDKNPPNACQKDKNPLSINEVLPQKVGMTTVFKGVEVTMTHSGTENVAANGASKKKKKKKSKQQVTETVPPETKSKEEDPAESFFKFSENHIELVNHPEITVTSLPKPVANNPEDNVTISKSAKKAAKKKKAQETKNSVVQEKVPEAPIVATASKKKKKKKKGAAKEEEKKENAPAQPPANPPEARSSSPTYVKLPAAGDTCVLLVSHESFLNGGRTTENEKKLTEGSGGTVLIKNKEMSAESKGFPLNFQIESQPSISILPVDAGTSKNPSESKGINMAQSLEKVSNMIKAEEAQSQTTQQDAADSTTLTKAQLKAERRAKQEAQRAAKQAKGTAKDSVNTQATDKNKADEVNAPSTKTSENSAGPSSKKVLPKPTVEKEKSKGVNIFSHLPMRKDFSKVYKANSDIHPAILEIGTLFNKGVLCGSNSRCVGFLYAFREVIGDNQTPAGKELSRDLESKLQSYLNFLNNCRLLSVSILNCVKFLKHQINHVPKGMDEVQVKEELCNSINNFVQEEILLAKEAICISSTAKIVDGDCILVYAYSSLVKDVLCKAFDQNKIFQVIVVDSRTKMEGREMLRALVKHGLRCSYTLDDSASCAMKKASKVIIGAHALLSNGSVMSRLGCSDLAFLASQYNVPVLVCCETYKFCERALTDSFVHNELGSLEDLIETGLHKNDSLKNWKSLPSLQMYNILYDVTPSELISVVITEKGLLPCTSVPVVLRVKHACFQE